MCTAMGFCVQLSVLKKNIVKKPIMKISHKFIIKFHQLHLMDLKLHEDEDKSKQSWLLGVIHQVGIIWLCLKASVPFVTRSQAKPIVKNDITRLHRNHSVCRKILP